MTLFNKSVSNVLTRFLTLTTRSPLCALKNNSATPQESVTHLLAKNPTKSPWTPTDLSRLLGCTCTPWSYRNSKLALNGKSVTSTELALAKTLLAPSTLLKICAELFTATPTTYVLLAQARMTTALMITNVVCLSACLAKTSQLELLSESLSEP